MVPETELVSGDLQRIRELRLNRKKKSFNTIQLKANL